MAAAAAGAPVPLMRTHLVGAFLAHLRGEGRGEAAEALAQRFALGAVDPLAPAGGAVEITLAELYAFCDAAAAAAGDPDFGLHAAQRFVRGSYGLVEFRARAAGTVREGFAAFSRYYALINDRVRLTHDEHGDEARVDHVLPGHPLCVGRHGNEFTVAALLLAMRALTGAPCVPRRVWFAHATPPDWSALRACLGTSHVTFGAEGNGFALDRALLDARLSTADPPLGTVLDRQAAMVLEVAPAAPPDLLALARARILAALPGGPPSLEQVARALRTTPRSLQRRLGADGVSFTALVEQVRRDAAGKLLDDRALSLADVAARLGYSEMSAFVRAFKRWTGQTPGAYRAPR